MTTGSAYDSEEIPGFTDLINRLSKKDICSLGVIDWACPIPYFGNPSTSVLATVGINPSNREFETKDGKELAGCYRRFPTLRSLRISAWSDISAEHIQEIQHSCIKYFGINPYDAWFKPLDLLISGTRSSFYGARPTACHLDLIPYATSNKWSALTGQQRKKLIELSIEYLATTLAQSDIKYLVLNGRSVIEVFKEMSGVSFKEHQQPSWNLRRTNTRDVLGYAYTGKIRSLSGISFKRDISVLGFNHNIQSSFGVTSDVKKSISKWIGEKIVEATK